MCPPIRLPDLLRFLASLAEAGDGGDGTTDGLSGDAHFRTPAERSQDPSLRHEEPRLIRRSNMIPETPPAGFYPIIPMPGG